MTRVLIICAPPRIQTDQVEQSTTDFPSGGGFSNNFARPAWQDAAVQNYLDNFVPDYAASVFNRSGRAYPDVAANGYVPVSPPIPVRKERKENEGESK
jgi:tripeptidyl-peptidase-1